MFGNQSAPVPVSNQSIASQIKLELNEHFNVLINNLVNDHFGKLENTVKREVRSVIEQVANEYVANQFNTMFKSKIDDEFKQKVEDMISSFSTSLSTKVDHHFEIIKGFKSFMQYENVNMRINNLERDMGETRRLSKEAMSKYDRLTTMSPEIRTETYSDEQIKTAFQSSTVKLEDIEKRFGVSKPRASQYVNGQIKDPSTRHLLYEFITSYEAK